MCFNHWLFLNLLKERTVTRDSNPTKFLSVIVYRLSFLRLSFIVYRLSVIAFAVIVYRVSFIVYRLSVMVYRLSVSGCRQWIWTSIHVCF